MLLFRMADLPRRVQRLVPALPLDPSADRTDGAGAALVGWSLAPAVLDPGSRRLRTRLNHILAAYTEAEGKPRGVLEEESARLEEVVGDYRLSRCLCRTVEHLGYHFVAPPPPLPHEPAALRALCYRRAAERHGGYVPRAQRAAFLAAVAAELETSPDRLEAALWADRASAALLQRRQDGPGGQPVAAALRPACVIAVYNAAAAATVVAASSLVTLYLDARETAALKDLYRHARALHVGVDIARGATEDLLELRLYGPGSRALVRSRAAVGDPFLSVAPSVDPGADRVNAESDDGDGIDAEAATGETNAEAASAADGESGAYLADTDEDGDTETGAHIADKGADSGDDTTAVAPAGEPRLPAAGGAPVAAVVTRLAQRHPGALRGGWTRLLGFERRVFHVALEGDLLDALRGDAEAGTDGTERELFDSAVEEQFARAFHAQEPAGRGGLVRGWRLRREPRIVVVDTSVFLPDFSFQRGEVEVYGEVIGFYTEEYLARKTRKLTALRGRLPLLLIVERDLAPLFAATGFPLVTYKAGRQIGIPEVIAVLERDFDPFARRREGARVTLARLCATAGPDMPEEELLAAIGCAGRSELLTLWAEVAPDTDEHGGTALPGERAGRAPSEELAEVASPELLRRVAEARTGYDAGEQADRLPRRYLPGYGLVQGGAVEAARAALHALLDAVGGPVALEDALECVRRAGIVGPDEALLERLGAQVARAGLFGAAQVYRQGMAVDDLEAAGEPGAPVALAKPRRRSRKAAPAPDTADQEGLPLAPLHE